MPRTEQVLSVFVASPSDVADERNKLEEIIQELNLTWSRELGLRLELVRWETHALPGIGSEPQDVINTSIPDDYDIFIGVMWCKFGTPTAQFGSGTIEEFQRAKKRVETAGDDLKLMMYFRDSPPVSMSQINGEELARIQKFRENLGPEGILYWKYKGLDDFEKLLRLHLSKQAQNWNIQNKINKKSNDEIKDKPSVGHQLNPLDDLGILELQDLVEIQFNSLSETLSRIRSYMNEMTELNAVLTDDLNRAAERKHVDPVRSRQDVKKIMSKVALNMDHFADRIEAEVPIFRQSLSEGLNATIKTIEVSVDFSKGENHAEEMEAAKRSLEETLDALDGAMQSFAGMISSVESLPRLTSDMNKSKRKVASAMGKLMEEMTIGRRLAVEAVSAIESTARN